jgi:hypothetical protein
MNCRIHAIVRCLRARGGGAATFDPNAVVRVGVGEQPVQEKLPLRWDQAGGRQRAPNPLTTTLLEVRRYNAINFLLDSSNERAHLRFVEKGILEASLHDLQNFPTG